MLMSSISCATRRGGEDVLLCNVQRHKAQTQVRLQKHKHNYREHKYNFTTTYFLLMSSNFLSDSAKTYRASFRWFSNSSEKKGKKHFSNSSEKQRVEKKHVQLIGLVRMKDLKMEKKPMSSSLVEMSSSSLFF